MQSKTDIWKVITNWMVSESLTADCEEFQKFLNQEKEILSKMKREHFEIITDTTEKMKQIQIEVKELSEKQKEKKDRIKEIHRQNKEKLLNFFANYMPRGETESSVKNQQYESELKVSSTTMPLQETTRVVTEIAKIQTKIQQEIKPQAIKNPNRDDENLPCFQVGKMQEKKMEEFLKRIQIMKPQKQSPQFQKDNQAFTNSNKSLVNQSIVNQSIVNQTMLNNSINDQTFINPVEKEGMTSKADFFSSDSEEENKASDEKEEGEISDSDSCQNEIAEQANDDLNDMLREQFEDFDIQRLKSNGLIAQSYVPLIVEFLERQKNELYFTDDSKCHAHHISVQVGTQQTIFISCLKQESLSDGFEKVIQAMTQSDFDTKSIKFNIK